MKIGSHVGMSGKEMLLGSAKEAVSYNANTFMFYTGAPQNTRRKDISELLRSSYELFSSGTDTMLLPKFQAILHFPQMLLLIFL